MTGERTMTRERLIERIGRGVFVVDGAMGTQLMLASVEAHECNE